MNNPNNMKLKKIFFLIPVILISCKSKSYRTDSINYAKYVNENLTEILKAIAVIENKYTLNFDKNIRYRIVDGRKDTCFRNMVYDSSIRKIFHKFELDEISLEKNIRCTASATYSEVILYHKDGQTSCHYYKCKYPFSYKNEIDNELAFLKIINDSVEVVYEK